jgi:uroporphyrinogen decarboxylase
MNSREIINTIIRDKQCPERMGIYEHFWDDTQNEWEKQGLPKGVDIIEYFDYDIKPVPGGDLNTQAIVREPIIVEETEHTIVKINGWGAKLRYWKHKSGTPEHIAFDLTDEKIWREKYRPHLLDLNPRRLGDIDRLRRNYAKCMATGKFVVYTNVMIFEIMRASMGDIIMLESMYLNPAWIHDFCDVITNMQIMHWDYLFSEVGLPDGMFLYEDMGYTYAPFISPQLQREMIAPYHKRTADFIHSHGIPFIMHSCGKIEPFLQAIVDSGVDCLQVLEAKAGQHVVDMAKSVDSKIAFMGNLNIVAFETNNRCELDNEIIPKLEAINENKIPYVFHSDHSIPKTVKLETYKYALDLFTKHGKYH